MSLGVLRDGNNHIAKTLGLVFAIPEALRPSYEKFGIDISAYSDDDGFELPIPAT